MSSKLAKVLLICALAVVLPLFIAGTVIAVYYSMNAATVFEIYTDNQNISAPTITSGATIEYDAENGSYRVINGHSKDTSVEYSAEGFNFDYWFDGSREEYVKLIGDIESDERGGGAFFGASASGVGRTSSPRRMAAVLQRCSVNLQTHQHMILLALL